MRRFDRAQGFGLLEALVALTLMASAGVALFGWINSNLSTAARLRAHEQMQVQRQIAGAWLQSVDPWREPTGESSPMPGWRLRWQSFPLSDATAVPPWTGGTKSAWEARLFDVQAELEAEGLTQRFSISRLAVRRTVPFGALPTVDNANSSGESPSP